MREIDGVLYVNDGDWVESCTALVEHTDGRLELIDWAARHRLSFLGAAAAGTPASAAPAESAAPEPAAMTPTRLPSAAS